jgi:endonuclease/exonuclease/phosphatase (EEP) superfamily protein YafD
MRQPFAGLGRSGYLCRRTFEFMKPSDLVKKWSSLLVLAACLVACEKPAPEMPQAPPVLLSENQLARIAVDLHIIEAQVEALNLPPDSAFALYGQLEKELLTTRYQTDTAIYRQNFRYYQAQLPVFQRIYQQVMDTIDARRKVIELKGTRTILHTDSGAVTAQGVRIGTDAPGAPSLPVDTAVRDSRKKSLSLQ